MAYQIGEFVRVKDKQELAEEDNRVFNTRTARRSGESGVIVDRLYSEANECYVYCIKFDGDTTASRCKFTEDEIEYAPTIQDFRFSIERNGNRIYAYMYDGEEIVESAYGNIAYENNIGITQAASHAMRTIYKRLKGEI